MNTSVIIIECIVVMACSFLIYKKVCHPAFLMALFFLLVSVFSTYKLSELIEPNDVTVTAVFLGIICFSIGTFIGGIVKQISHKKPLQSLYSSETLVKSELWVKAYKVIIYIGVFSTLLHAVIVLRYLLVGFSFGASAAMENPFRHAYATGFSTRN